MCHFVLAALPPQADLERVRPIAKKFSHPLYDADIALTEVAPARPLTLYYTTKHCDCGTAVGAGAEKRPPWRPSDKELRKLRRKGWSDNKIARWVAENRKTQARRQVEEAQFEQQSLPELESWLALAAAILDSREAGRFGVLLAWSPGRSIELEGEVRIPINEATPTMLFQAKENFLYTFTRAGTAA